MVLLTAGKIVVNQKYGIGMISPWDPSDEELSHIAMGDYGITIQIDGETYKALPMYVAVRSNRTSDDGRYHLIYIQINMRTGEYYIGKVNRKSWKEVERYPGSGLLFTKKYGKHVEDFVRYYIASCKTDKESEKLEARIVNKSLLEDVFCLNLVQGGGGVTGRTTEERNEKIREHMISHPENYQGMLEKSKELYQSGGSAALDARNNSIRKTMNADKYRDMSRKRFANWRENNPKAYAEARRKNKEALQTDSYKKKHRESYDRWRNENPEEYEHNKKKCLEAMHSEEAEKKRRKSLKKWCEENPEIVMQRVQASVEKCRKPVNMLSLATGEVLETFESGNAAALWLVEHGYARNTNCKASISAVCLKKPCTTGYGYRKKAYGFGWEFAEKE